MTRASAIIRDERASYDEMAIVEKYEDFLNYAYPKIQNCPRKHGIVRDTVLAAVLEPVGGFYAAGRSSQVSRLYALDAQLATIRFWLRFLSRPSRAVLTTHQAAESLKRLNEVGRMLGAWIGKLSGRAPAAPKDKGSDAHARPLG
jgi:hypothetical protein